MFFCNLASDQVCIQQPHTPAIYIQKHDVIDTLPQIILSLCAQPQDRCYMLTGPGSFTTLRVGALVFNTVFATTHSSCSINTLSKIEFYATLVAKKIVPRFGCIYIGQKKFVRLYDFDTNTYERISYEAISSLDKDFFCDRQDEYTDEIYAKNKIQRNTTATEIDISLHNTHTTIALSAFPRHTVSTVTPVYMIDPV